MPNAHDVAGEEICGSPATLSKRRGRKKRGGGRRKGVLGRGSRDREGASVGGPGGFNDFCLSLARAPRMQGPAGQWPAGVCGTLQKWAAEVSRAALDAGGRGCGCTGRRWELETLKHTSLQGRNRLQAWELGRARFTGTRTLTHSHTLTLSHSHPPLAHTHLRPKPVDCKDPRLLQIRTRSACFPD